MEHLVKQRGNLIVLRKRNIYTIVCNPIGYKPTDTQTLLTHVHLQLTPSSESWLLYNEVMQLLAV